jgi:hypothetical protein
MSSSCVPFHQGGFPSGTFFSSLPCPAALRAFSSHAVHHRPTAPQQHRAVARPKRQPLRSAVCGHRPSTFKRSASHHLLVPSYSRVVGWPVSGFAHSLPSAGEFCQTNSKTGKQNSKTAKQQTVKQPNTAKNCQCQTHPETQQRNRCKEEKQTHFLCPERRQSRRSCSGRTAACQPVTWEARIFPLDARAFPSATATKSLAEFLLQGRT